MPGRAARCFGALIFVGGRRSDSCGVFFRRAVCVTSDDVDPVEFVQDSIVIRHGVGRDGEMVFGVSVEGDSLLSTYLGLLRLAELELVREFLGDDG